MVDGLDRDLSIHIYIVKWTFVLHFLQIICTHSHTQRERTIPQYNIKIESRQIQIEREKARTHSSMFEITIAYIRCKDGREKSMVIIGSAVGFCTMRRIQNMTVNWLFVDVSTI